MQSGVPGRPFDNARGLQAGDEFVEINGEHVYTQQDIVILLDRDADGKHDITVIRNGEKVELTNVLMQRDYYGENGAALYGFSTGLQEKTFGSVVSYTWNQSMDFVRLVRLGLTDLFTGGHHFYRGRTGRTV